MLAVVRPTHPKATAKVSLLGAGFLAAQYSVTGAVVVPPVLAIQNKLGTGRPPNR